MEKEQANFRGNLSDEGNEKSPFLETVPCQQQYILQLSRGDRYSGQLSTCVNLQPSRIKMLF